MSNAISEVTRRAIIDYFVADEVYWAGRLKDHEFLSRLYDLTQMRSTDYRFRTAAADIQQHRADWDDWDDDWVFNDSRFNLLHTSDEKFLAFLCETVHPVVRPDSEQVARIVEALNGHLRADGWRLVRKTELSGKPVFAAQPTDARVEVFSEPTGWTKVDRQLQEARLILETAKNEEQYQAVGLICREALISVAQEVYDSDSHPPTDGTAPSETDARRMLEAVFSAELRGSANKEARSHARAALRLAIALQHKRTADFRTAALCAEATASVVNLVAVVSGRRQ